MDEMANSAGALDEAYSVYLGSAEAHINQFKAAYEELARSAVETGLVNFFVDAGTAILNFAASLQEVGALMPILATIGGLLGASGNPAGWVLLVASTLGEIAQIVQAIEDAIPSLEKVNEEFGKLEVKTTALGKTASNLRTAQTDIIPRFAELANGVDSVGRNLTLTDEEYSEFLKLNNQLAQLLPDNVAYYNENGDAVLDLAYNTDTLSESLNRLVEAQLAATQASFGQTLQEYIDLVDQAKTLNQGAIDDAQRMIDTLNALLSGESVSFGFGLSGQNAAEGLKGILDRNGIKSQLSQGLSGFAISVDAIDESAREAVRHYIDVLELQISEAEGRVQAAWDRLTPAMKGWIQSDVLFQELPDQAQQAAIAMVNAMDPQALGLDSSDAIKTYITNNIIQPLYSSAPQISDAFAQAMSFEEAFQKGEISAEEYAEKVRLAMLSLWTVMGGDFVPMMNSLGYEGSYFNEVLDNMTSAMGSVETAADSAGASLKNAFDAKGLQTAVSTLKSAFDDLGKEGSTGVVYSNLEKIREAFGTSVPNIDEYINRIISAGTNTEAVTGIFNELINAKVTDIARTQDLTSANEAQIASMLREIGVVNADQAAHELMRQAKLEEVAALLDVADASQYTAQELYELMLTEIQANNTGMTFSQQIDALRKLAEAAGIAAGSIRSLQTVQDSLVFDESGMIDVAASNKNRARADEHNAVSDSIKEIREAFSGLGTSLPQTTVDFGGFAAVATGAGSAAKEAAESAEEAAEAVEELANSFSNLKTAYNAIQTAEEEMKDGGGLSADTIRALSAAGAEYINCLYAQDGAIRLNTIAYQQYLAEGVRANITAAQEEIAALQASNEALIARRDALLASSPSNSAASAEIDDLNLKIEENTLKLQENEMQLLLYKMDVDGLTASVESYSMALENLGEVSALVKETASSMKTLADLQTEISDGYTLELETALQYAEVFPEILEAAQATADGRLALDAEVVQAVIANRQAEYQAAIQEKIMELEAERALLVSRRALKQSQLEFLQRVASGEIKIDKEKALTIVKLNAAAVQALIDQGYSEQEANYMVAQTMLKNTNGLIQVTDNLADTYGVDVVNAMAIAGDASADNFGAIIENINQAIDAAHELGAAIAAAAKGGQAGSKVDFNGAGGKAETYDAMARLGDAAELLSEGAKWTGKITDDLSSIDEEFTSKIAELTTEIAALDEEIAQTDGQIQVLEALMNKPVSAYMPKSTTEALKETEEAAKAVEKAMEDAAESSESWFEALYKIHRHLLEMGAESQRSYLDWLEAAYKQAAHEGILTLDEFFKYQEEVYKGFQDLFKQDISNGEFMIEVRSNFEGESETIVQLYEQMLKDVADEIAAFRRSGRDETDEYLQYLEKKYLDLEKSLKDYREDITNDAKTSLDKLVDLRKKMLDQSLEDEKESIDTRLKELQDFYNKQTDMLKDQHKEEEYLDKQAEHRQKVARLRSQLAQLEVDDSAWAQKRKLELAEELADAQKDLDDFERDHAREVTEEQLKETYEAQKKGLEDQKQLLSDQVAEANDLYEQALEDIRNGSVALYEEMVTWNELYGDGIEDTIKNAWEEAYKALAEYKALYGTLYEDVDLSNATGYTGSGKYEESVIGTPYIPPAETTPPMLVNGSLITVKRSAHYYSKRSGYEKISPDVPGGQYLIYDVQGDEVLIGRDGLRIGWIKKTDIEGYASGTNRARRGLHRIDERGTETIFESQNGQKYRMFTGGEMVLTARQSRFLYNFVKDNAKIGGYVSKGLIKPPDAGINPPPKRYEIQMGNITINGNADKYTVSEIRRAQRDNIDTLLKEFNKLNK